MNKSDLVKKIAEKCGYSQKDVKEVIDCFETVVVETLTAKEDVKTGIATFVVKATAARKGRNPMTGESIDVPAGFKVSTKLSKAVKESVK